MFLHSLGDVPQENFHSGLSLSFWRFSFIFEKECSLHTKANSAHTSSGKMSKIALYRISVQHIYPIKYQILSKWKKAMVTLKNIWSPSPCHHHSLLHWRWDLGNCSASCANCPLDKFPFLSQEGQVSFSSSSKTSQIWVSSKQHTPLDNRSSCPPQHGVTVPHLRKSFEEKGYKRMHCTLFSSW